MQPCNRWTPLHGTNENGGGAGSFHPPAKYVDTSCCVSASMLTEKRAAWRMASLMCADLPQQNSTSGGAGDGDLKALGVMPRTSPSTSAAITVTPVAKWPTVWRNVRASNESA